MIKNKLFRVFLRQVFTEKWDAKPNHVSSHFQTLHAGDFYKFLMSLRVALGYFPKLRSHKWIFSTFAREGMCVLVSNIIRAQFNVFSASKTKQM